MKTVIARTASAARARVSGRAFLIEAADEAGRSALRSIGQSAARGGERSAAARAATAACVRSGLAARTAVGSWNRAAGVVVVTSARNDGEDEERRTQSDGVTQRHS